MKSTGNKRKQFINYWVIRLGLVDSFSFHSFAVVCLFAEFWFIAEMNPEWIKLTKPQWMRMEWNQQPSQPSHVQLEPAVCWLNSVLDSCGKFNAPKHSLPQWIRNSKQTWLQFHYLPSPFCLAANWSNKLNLNSVNEIQLKFITAMNWSLIYFWIRFVWLINAASHQTVIIVRNSLAPINQLLDSISANQFH